MLNKKEKLEQLEREGKLPFRCLQNHKGGDTAMAAFKNMPYSKCISHE